MPCRSRLAEKIREVVQWKKEGISLEQAIDRVHAIYNEKNWHDWIHTIRNAMIVCIGLLFGETDLEKTIGVAAIGGFDTDCNGATAGSIMGMILGAKALTDKWIAPLNDTLKSGVEGFDLIKISELAAKTVDVVKRVQPVSDSVYEKGV